MRIEKISLGILLLILLKGCSKNEVYDETYSFPSDVWNYDQIIEFDFNIPDTSKAYDIFLQVRNSGLYSAR